MSEAHRTNAIGALADAFVACGCAPDRAETAARDAVDAITDHSVETFRDLMRAERELHPLRVFEVAPDGTTEVKSEER
jgi:hypothetical protein